MADLTLVAPKKKKSLLPVFVVLAAIIGGGGFFVLKSQGTKAPKNVKVELAEKDTDLEEFLTNTSNPAVYVRAKISVRLRKDYEETLFKANDADIRDAVIMVLNSTAPADITDSTKRGDLKKKLAEAMNTALEGPLDPPPAPVQSDQPRRRGKKTEVTQTPPPVAAPVDDWDSETGPVMKVRFSNLATQ